MKLKHPFTDETRLLYLYRHDCDLCGKNQRLELHHITGRRSRSPFNASLLCHECHSHVGHTKEEERKLFKINLAFLQREKYEPTEYDWQFIRENPHLVDN